MSRTSFILLERLRHAPGGTARQRMIDMLVAGIRLLIPDP